MSNQQATKHHHKHKIKAEWTKSVENSEKTKEEQQKIEIIDQVVISPSRKKNKKKIESKKCSICEKTFSIDDGSFQDHVKSHENSFFECPEESCKKQFKRKSSLRKHLYFHKGIFKYTCADCDSSFVDRVKYEVHIAAKHKKTEREFECGECHKKFATSDYLRRHQVIHKDEFKYSCNQCNHKFKWLTSLQSHVLIHTQNKARLQCHQCFKCFFNIRALERHRKIHQFVNYQCGICLAISSKRKDNILRHIRHLHQEVSRADIINHINVIQERTKAPTQDIEEIEINDDEDDDDDSNILIIDESVREEPEEVIEPVVVNNRVNVIQSIGNPNKNVKAQEDEEIVQSKPQEEPPTEIQLPPKKKATAKYNPIEQYRKIFGLDTETPPETETSTAEENQVFPDHWRKRTSLLFRR